MTKTAKVGSQIACMTEDDCDRNFFVVVICDCGCATCIIEGSNIGFVDLPMCANLYISRYRNIMPRQADD